MAWKYSPFSHFPNFGKRGIWVAIMGPFVFHHNYAISCVGGVWWGRKSLPGEAIFKKWHFWDKNPKKIDFFDFLIFRVSSLFTLPRCFGHFLALKSIVFKGFWKRHDTTRPDPNRTDPTRPDPTRRISRARIRQFSYRIAIPRPWSPTRPPTPEVTRPVVSAKGSISPNLLGGGQVLMFFLAIFLRFLLA